MNAHIFHVISQRRKTRDQVYDCKFVWSHHIGKTFLTIKKETLDIEIPGLDISFKIHQSLSCHFKMRSKEKKHSTMCCVPFLYPFLLFTSIYSVSGLPSYCYHYYSEFSLNDDYNPTIYPEVNTTITDITTLYKVSEVIYLSILSLIYRWLSFIFSKLK